MSSSSSRRNRIYEKYLNTNKQYVFSEAVGKTASQVNNDWKGEAERETIVIRIDLNGYSKWSKEKSNKDRIALLDVFFSICIPRIVGFNGVYFRDEGDCIVALVGDYQENFNSSNVWSGLKNIIRECAEQMVLQPKICLSLSKVLYYQKMFEIGSDDYSAEGQAFVHASRLESAIDSKERIYLFPDEGLKAIFYSESNSHSDSNTSAPWTWDSCGAYIAGIQGQKTVEFLEYNGSM